LAPFGVTITDHGAPDRLIGAATPVAGKAALHETVRDGNVMKMRPVAGLAVGPKAPTSLLTMGYHIMLTDVKQPLAGGRTFPLTPAFATPGAVRTKVTVKAACGAAGMDMGGVGHDMQHMAMPGMTKP
jgi:copper(I)-binding protein